MNVSMTLDRFFEVLRRGLSRRILEPATTSTDGPVGYALPTGTPRPDPTAWPDYSELMRTRATHAGSLYRAPNLYGAYGPITAVLVLCSGVPFKPGAWRTACLMLGLGNAPGEHEVPWELYVAGLREVGVNRPAFAVRARLMDLHREHRRER